MELSVQQINPPSADGIYNVYAPGCVTASLFWANDNGPLEDWMSFAIFSIDPNGIHKKKGAACNHCITTPKRVLKPKPALKMQGHSVSLHQISIFLKYFYIMPPIPPAGIAGAATGSGISVMAHSVVRNIPATEAAFSRATRDTLVGSITPASNIFTYSSVRAL